MRLVLVGSLPLVAACAGDLVFACESTQQCRIDGDGVCESTGYCSVRDPDCPEGTRYVEHASAELAGRCVEHGALVARWPFEDGFGGTTADASGNSHTGNLTNGPAWTDGVTGGGLAFDGTDDWIEVPTIKGFGGATFSAFAWIESADTDVQGRVMGISFTGGYLYLNFGDGRPEIEAHDSTGAIWSVADPTVDLKDQQWHHVGFVIDRELQEARIYIDGRFKERTANTSPGTFGGDDDPLAGPFVFGAQGFNRADLAWQGVLDEARIYAGAPSDREIRAMFEADAPSP